MSTDVQISRETSRRIGSACLCFFTQRAARALARHFDEVFRPLGLTNGQFSLMLSLNRPEPPTIRDVSASLAMDRTTLTAALKPLERRGLVKVEVDPADRRSRRLSLTVDGHKILAVAVPLWDAAHEAVEAHLPLADPDRLRGDLAALAALQSL